MTLRYILLTKLIEMRAQLSELPENQSSFSFMANRISLKSTYIYHQLKWLFLEEDTRHVAVHPHLANRIAEFLRL